MKQPKVRFSSFDEKSVEYLFMSFLEMGFLLTKAYTKKRYICFGQKKFFVEMEQTREADEILLVKAIEREDYMEAKRISTKIIETENFKF